MDNEQIRLTEDEIRTGLSFVGEAQCARARYEAIAAMESAFIQQMAEKYNIDLEHYQLVDWISGFQKVDEAHSH